MKDAKVCPRGTKRIGNECVRGLRRFILIRDHKILLQQGDFTKLEKEYGLEWLTYHDKTRPFFKDYDYHIAQDIKSDAPEIEMYPGSNEGYLVNCAVYNPKSPNEIMGHITAKTFAKDSAMKFAKDLWYVSGGD